jgi:hypothetical protein
MSGKSFMNGGGESYSGVVPAKQPNKGAKSPAEAVEERPLAKENTQEPNSCRTPSRESEPNGLARVREAAKKRAQKSNRGIAVVLGRYDPDQPEPCERRSERNGS